MRAGVSEQYAGDGIKALRGSWRLRWSTPNDWERRQRRTKRQYFWLLLNIMFTVNK